MGKIMLLCKTCKSVKTVRKCSDSLFISQTGRPPARYMGDKAVEPQKLPRIEWVAQCTG
jgi:hypothetical protein